MSRDLSWARGGPLPERRARAAPPPPAPPPAPPAPPPASSPVALSRSTRAEAPSGEIPDGEVLIVALPRFICPVCDGRVTSYGSVKSGGRRYHRCRDCDFRFQSIAVPLRYLRCPEALRSQLGL